MSTLIDHWSGEINRLTPALTDARTHLGAARTILTKAQKDSRTLSDQARAASDAVDAARKALAGIPTPGDGDPLLVAMSTALITLHDTRLTQTSFDLDLQGAKAEEARWLARESALSAELALAEAALTREKTAAKARQADIDALTTGTWATLATNADAALTASQTQAKARVEGEFPSSGTVSKDFLRRVRARRALVATSLGQRATDLTTTQDADQDAVATAQRRFDAAWQAVHAVIEAAPRLADDRDTLVRLAAMPAPTATTFPIVTLAQHKALFDTALKPTREGLLAKLKLADDAYETWLGAKLTYEVALHAAMKAHPDLTPLQLDTTIVSTEKAAMDSKANDRDTARADVVPDPATYATLAAWFAAVPDALWEALDQLDGAIARLTLLKTPLTTPLADLAARETELVTALAAAALARRTQAAADDAAVLIAMEAQAEQNVAARRAKAASRSTGALWTPPLP